MASHTAVWLPLLGTSPHSEWLPLIGLPALGGDMEMDGRQELAGGAGKSATPFAAIIPSYCGGVGGGDDYYMQTLPSCGHVPPHPSGCTW